MLALTLNGDLRLRRDYPAPVAPPGEALVRVLLAGICNTDLELARGYMGFKGVPGHEFVGRVEVASTPDLLGRRVVGEINAACGSCELCWQGLGTHCSNRTVLGILNRDGSHAQFLTLPIPNLHLVPDHVSNEEAVFVEPLAAAFEVLEQVLLPRDGRCAVVGDGKLGLLVAQVLQSAGTRVLLVGKHAEKLALAASWGIEVAGAHSPPRTRFDLVVECSGAPGGFEFAQRLVRPRGTLVLKSTYAGRANLDLAPIVIDEVTLIGSRCGPFPRALEALAERRIQVRPLIGARYPLADAPAAYDAAQQPGVLKVLLEP